MASSIQAIEGRSVHKIQSGQVIVDLCSVAKELVENSLDAGATAIDVRFRGYGLESIEVQDNGSGIAREDYESVALKHYTSKLRSYEDLYGLRTFGFRGEALSSLCALADVHIVTAREADAPKGSRLDFDASGHLRDTQVIAAQRGTTVAVEKIFKSLPVRRQELEKNAKREYGKVLSLLQAYACISVGVKFSVSSVVGKKKTQVFSTKANETTRENVANVFGAKTLSALTPLDLRFEMQSSHGGGNDDQKHVKITGHVSKPVVGEGRQMPDRQMFFVNSRPCALPQVAKVMNEVYKNYNITQSPFIFADVMLDTNAYDVNVSPDKRTILLHDQGVLLESIKNSLTKLFDDQIQTVPLTQASSSIQRMPVQRKLTSSQTISSTEEQEGPEREQDEGGGSSEEEEDGAANPPTSSRPSGLMNQFLAQRPREISGNATRDSATLSNTPADEAPLETSEMRGQEARSRSPEAAIPSVSTTPVKSSTGAVPNAFDRMRPLRTPSEIATVTIGDKTISTRIGTSFMRASHVPKSRMTRGSRPSLSTATRFGAALRGFAAPGTQEVASSQDQEVEEDSDEADESSVEEGSQDSEVLGTTAIVQEDDDDDADGGDLNENAISAEGSGSDDEWLDEDTKKAREEAKVALLIQEAEDSSARPSQDIERRAAKLLKGGHKDATSKLQQKIDVSIESVAQRFSAFVRTVQRLNSLPQESSTGEKADSGGVLEAAKDGISAEDRLSLTVSKSDFNRMRIVGQFNLGFIIAVRPASDDLFIIDQHASDEKYNFERLQATTVVQSQRLVRPQTLQLTAIEEETAVDHLSALQRNGFIITVADNYSTAVNSDGEEEEAEPPQDPASSSPRMVGNRLTLHAAPALSKSNTSAALKDLEELLALLPENPHARPASVRKVLAMRACRSSIMVGKALTTKKMEAVVRHMGGMDKPWNCPHGRPTMRHLGALGGKGGFFGSRENEEVDDGEGGNGSGRAGGDFWMEGDGVVGIMTSEDDDVMQGRLMAGRGRVDWEGWLASLCDEEGEVDGETEDDGGDDDDDDEAEAKIEAEEEAEEGEGEEDEEEEEEEEDEEPMAM